MGGAANKLKNKQKNNNGMFSIYTRHKPGCVSVCVLVGGLLLGE